MVLKRFVRIRKSDISLWLLLIPFFQPEYLDTLPGIAGLWKAWAALAIVAVFALWSIRETLPRRQVQFVCCLGAYFGWYVLTTALHAVALGVNYFGRIGMILALSMLVQLGMAEEGTRFLHKLGLYLQVLVWVNFITGPATGFAGLYREENGHFGYFLGHKNALAPIYVLLITVTALEEQLRFGRVRRKIKGFLCLTGLTIVPFASGTGTLCCAILLLAVVLPGKRWLCYGSAWHGYGAAQVLLVFAGVTRWLQPLFGLVNKDATFTGRTHIWREALSRIGASAEALVLGHGRTVANYIPYHGNWYTAHNMLLEILHQGGLVALALFFGVAFSARPIGKGTRFAIVNWGLLACLLCALTESLVVSPYFYALLSLPVALGKGETE